MPTLADAVKCAITSQRTRLSGSRSPTQMYTPRSTELCNGRKPVEHFQPIHDCPSVIIGCNPRPLLEALGTVDTESSLQNPQYVPLRDALTMLSPLSLPRMSCQTSETRRKYRNKTSKPLKMRAYFGHQKFPKDRVTRSVII